VLAKTRRHLQPKNDQDEACPNSAAQLLLAADKPPYRARR